MEKAKTTCMKMLASLKYLLSQTASFNRSARLFLIGIFIEGIIYSAWMLFFNFYIIERGFDREYLGLVNALPSLSALLFGIPLGVLSDRIGRRRSMLLGMSCSLVCMSLEVTVLDGNLVLLFAFLGGVGNMLYYVSQAPFMMQASNQENRALLFSLNWGLVTLSGAIGSLFAGQLPDAFGAWLHVAPRSAGAYQAVLISSMALGSLTLIPFSMMRELKKPVATKITTPVDSIWQVIRDPITLKLSIPNLIIGFGAAVLIPYMNVFFLEKFSISDQKLGLLFSLLSILTGVGSIFAPYFVNFLGGKVRTVVFTQSASLVFLILVGFTPWYWLVSFSFLMRGTLMNMAVPIYHAFAMEQIDESRLGTVNSMLELAWQMGWTVGPYISGVVQESSGFAPLFIATVILYAFANLLTWGFFQRMDKPTIAIAI
jgi:MFS family permease